MGSCRDGAHGIIVDLNMCRYTSLSGTITMYYKFAVDTARNNGLRGEVCDIIVQIVVTIHDETPYIIGKYLSAVKLYFISITVGFKFLILDVILHS